MNESIENYSYNSLKEEKIDGKIYLMAPLCREHRETQGNLYYIFNNYFKQSQKKCRAIFEDRLDFINGDYVEPDIKVLCHQNNNSDIPVIVIEVLSKSTQERDLGVKMKKYAELGIKEYWIVTWELNSIAIYLLSDEKRYEFYKSYALFVLKDRLSEYEQKEAVKEFSPVSFPELIIQLEDVFDMFE